MKKFGFEKGDGTSVVWHTGGRLFMVSLNCASMENMMLNGSMGNNYLY